MTRPPLRSIPLADVLPLGSRPAIIVTMSVDQWDAMLSESYRLGYVLLELDSRARPIRAFQRATVAEERAS